jgi:hypothetical protein
MGVALTAAMREDVRVPACFSYFKAFYGTKMAQNAHPIIEKTEIFFLLEEAHNL